MIHSPGFEETSAVLVESGIISILDTDTDKDTDTAGSQFLNHFIISYFIDFTGLLGAILNRS